VLIWGKNRGGVMVKDKAGHPFEELGNIRVTYVSGEGRDKNANWAGSDVIRIQAYRESDSSSLHMGAEVPVKSPEDFVKLIEALCTVYAEGLREKKQGI
jgi:hypothetical protein